MKSEPSPKNGTDKKRFEIISPFLPSLSRNQPISKKLRRSRSSWTLINVVARDAETTKESEAVGGDHVVEGVPDGVEYEDAGEVEEAPREGHALEDAEDGGGLGEGDAVLDEDHRLDVERQPHVGEEGAAGGGLQRGEHQVRVGVVEAEEEGHGGVAQHAVAVEEQHPRGLGHALGHPVEGHQPLALHHLPLPLGVSGVQHHAPHQRQRRQDQQQVDLGSSLDPCLVLSQV